MILQELLIKFLPQIVSSSNEVPPASFPRHAQAGFSEVQKEALEAHES